MHLSDNLVSDEEMNRLIESHMEKAYSIAYKLAGNPSDAADLMQSAFARVLKHREKYNPQIGFDRWIHVIIRNLHVDSLRRSNHFHPVELSEQPEEIIALRDLTPDKEVERQYLQSDIQSLLMQLDPNLRIVIVLVDMEGYSYEEAAEILKWPLGTVCIRLHRARRVLREKILRGENR